MIAFSYRCVFRWIKSRLSLLCAFMSCSSSIGRNKVIPSVIVLSVESDDKTIDHLTQFHYITWHVSYSKTVKEPKEVEVKHTPFSSSSSSSIVIPQTTAPKEEISDTKVGFVSPIQREVNEAKMEDTVHPSAVVEPKVDLSATEHITPLYNSSFSSCPFAGVFPKYKNDYVHRASKEVIALLQSNRFRTPSRFDVADMRSRVRFVLLSYRVVLFQSVRV